MQDVVLLQEVFIEADAARLISAAKDGKLKHAHFYNAGMLRGELLLITAYPIVEVPLLQPLQAHKAHTLFSAPCQNLTSHSKRCDSMIGICRHIFMGMLLPATPLP